MTRLLTLEILSRFVKRSLYLTTISIFSITKHETTQVYIAVFFYFSGCSHRHSDWSAQVYRLKQVKTVTSLYGVWSPLYNLSALLIIGKEVPPTTCSPSYRINIFQVKSESLLYKSLNGTRNCIQANLHYCWHGVVQDQGSTCNKVQKNDFWVSLPQEYAPDNHN